jgi:hypothetical protein
MMHMLQMNFHLDRAVKRFISLYFRCLTRKIFVRALQSRGYDNVYRKAKDDCFRIGATQGIDALLQRYNLDALVVPAEGWPSGPTALAGVSAQLQHLMTRISDCDRTAGAFEEEWCAVRVGVYGNGRDSFDVV